MIEFHPCTMEDRDWIEKAMSCGHQRGCEYHFASIIAWQHHYNATVARVDGMFTEKVERKCPTFLFPVGCGDLNDAIRELEGYAREHGCRLILCGITPENRAVLEKLYPGRFEYQTNRDDYDYLYTLDQLADLRGRHYSGKRNFIHRFQSAYPDWRFEPLTPELLPECLEMADEWYALSNENRPDNASSLAAERVALKECLDNFEALRLEGGLLRAAGKTVAFTFGGRLHENSDTFDVQFEKAFLHYEGSFPMVNREFASYLRDRHPDLVYLNREEDLGIPGLRKAKESYRPVAMVEKGCAVERESGAS